MKEKVIDHFSLPVRWLTGSRERYSFVHGTKFGRYGDAIRLFGPDMQEVARVEAAAVIIAFRLFRPHIVVLLE